MKQKFQRNCKSYLQQERLKSFSKEWEVAAYKITSVTVSDFCNFIGARYLSES